MTDRHKWFYDRIGKKVYSNRQICPCSYCKEDFENGYTIDDNIDAMMLWDEESTSQAEGTGLIFFDTKEEALKYEK